MTRRSISVVIPVLNAERTVQRCLSALEALDPKPEEVILVDNGSTDGTCETLRTWAESHRGARLVEEPKRGASAARNAGVAAAGGDLIAFTDSDCAPETDWLLALQAGFSGADVGAVAGAVVPGGFSGHLESFSGLYTLRSSNVPSRHSQWTPWVGGFPTANLAIDRSLFEALGGFDESIGIYGEDYDLCARVYAAGRHIAYDNRARVAHHHRVSLRGLVRQAFGFGRSHAYMLGKRYVHGLWLQVPGRGIHFESFPGSAWIDLAGADKKLIGSALMGILYPPFFVLPLLYLTWLTYLARQRARAASLDQGVVGDLATAGLLLVKSGAMTAGRLWGSLRYGVLCV